MAFIVSDMLDEQDRALFGYHYVSSDRAAYSPRSMMEHHKGNNFP
ncbi:hypothetical protein [Photorhabdus heterorhabditis]|nr:hypothetical protein [Photorhabdus heterorhabditis]